MNDDQGVPELQGPPEVLEAIDEFLANPESGVRMGRPKRKTVTEQDYEEAALEVEGEEEEKWIDRHWLLIVGLGLVGIGLVIRWWVRRR